MTLSKIRHETRPISPQDLGQEYADKNKRRKATAGIAIGTLVATVVGFVVGNAAGNSPKAEKPTSVSAGNTEPTDTTISSSPDSTTGENIISPDGTYETSAAGFRIERQVHTVDQMKQMSLEDYEQQTSRGDKIIFAKEVCGAISGDYPDIDATTIPGSYLTKNLRAAYNFTDKETGDYDRITGVKCLGGVYYDAYTRPDALSDAYAAEKEDLLSLQGVDGRMGALYTAISGSGTELLVGTDYDGNPVQYKTAVYVRDGADTPRPLDAVFVYVPFRALDGTLDATYLRQKTVDA